MNYKSKNNRNFLVNMKEFSLILFFGFVTFLQRILKSFLLLSKFEKYLTFVLIIVVLGLHGAKIKGDYEVKTKLVPDFGGGYKEAVVGELKYLNPVLASSDTDKAVSSLIFSSLFKFDRENNVISDVATGYEISPEKLKYTVTLRDNVFFHDGVKLTNNDVVYTIETIKDPDFKSPHYDTWKDVAVKTDGENKVVFELPKAYGPFIYNLDFGILPVHLSADDFSKKIIGSGQFKFESTKKTGEKITKLNLTGNEQYYNERPYLARVQLDFFDKKEDAMKSTLEEQYSAVSNFDPKNNSFQDISYSTTKKLALIPNLRVEKFKNKEFRQKVLSDQKFDEKTKITLTTADSELQRNKAEELKSQFAARNIDLEIKYFKPTEMKEILNKKNFELLLYGIDFSHDPDPYVFWHSSQMDKMNFAGYSDKKSDILLEDARMITDSTERSAKYNQFFDTVKNEYLAVFYDPIKYNFVVSNKILGSKESSRIDAKSKYFGINKWYVNEKRVRK